MNVTLVYNPKSGGAYTPKELRQRFTSAGLLITRMLPSDSTLERRLGAPIRNSERIAVIGGDGTISRVAGLVAGTNAILVPLPGGTFNNFTKDLGVAQDLDMALANLKSATVRAIDVARVNELVFINNSSLGVYPHSLYYREQHEPRFGKWAAMAIGVLKTVVTFRLLRVEIDGIRYKTPFIFVGNNRYHVYGEAIGRRARLDEGLLTVVIATASTRSELIKIALLALLGKTKQLKEVKLLYPEAIAITIRRPVVSVSHDGEVTRLPTPLRYTLDKKSLNILA